MSVTEILDVQYHQQDREYYCGAACAQMVLLSMGTGLLDQDDLYNDNHSHSTIDADINWKTGPDGLAWTLNDLCPPAFNNALTLCPLDTEDEISRKICWTIRQHHVPPIALVFGWKHWVVVSGYAASAHPTSSSDNNYLIEAFDIKNPAPALGSYAQLPQHGPADGCGTGDDRGIATQHIPYPTWNSDYMTGVPTGCWQGKFIAMCDPEPPASPSPQPRPNGVPRPGDDLIPPDIAAERAVAGMKSYGLFERKDWQSALSEARPSDAILVQRLDRLDSYYWLVPFKKPAGTIAVASVDGRSGAYLQAALLPRHRGDLIKIGREEALERVVGRRFELDNGQGQLLVRRQAFSIYPHLVWRPCLESLSPYYPFYMFTVGNHHVYLRIDGEVFTTLGLDQTGG